MTTETRMGRPRGYIICLALGLAVGLVTGFLAGKSMGGTSVRVEAIKSRHAVWRVVDEHGNTQFEWLPSEQK